MQQITFGYTPPGGSPSTLTCDVYSCRGLFRPDELKLFPPIKNDYRDGTSDSQVQVLIPMITIDLEMGQFNSQVPMKGNFASDKSIQLGYWALDNAKTVDLGLTVPTPTANNTGSATTLANATYYYVVSAVDSLGETIAPDAKEVSVTITDNASQEPKITIPNITNAASYRIYRSTTTHTYGATCFLKEVAVAAGANTVVLDDGLTSLSTGTRRTVTLTSVVLEDVSKFMNNWENAKQFSKHYIIRLQRSNPITTWP